MSTAAKNVIVQKVKEMKHQLDICAEMISECVQQGTLKQHFDNAVIAAVYCLNDTKSSQTIHEVKIKTFFGRAYDTLSFFCITGR